jgi:hypothetical protein
VNSERLRAEYKAAFEQWVSQVNRLRTISSSPLSDVLIQQEESRVTAAEDAYRDSRDRLTRAMTADKTSVSACYSKSCS